MAKDEIVRYRVSKKEKSDLEKAAALSGDEGISVSEFVREASNSKAKRIIKNKDK